MTTCGTKRGYQRAVLQLLRTLAVVVEDNNRYDNKQLCALLRAIRPYSSRAVGKND